MKIKQRSELISKVNKALNEMIPFELTFAEFTAIWNLTKKQSVAVNWTVKTNPQTETVLIEEVKK